MDDYIELIGPPASGKSTIKKNLIKHESLFGGEGARRRIISKEVSLKYKLLNMIIPSLFPSYFDVFKCLKSQYENKAFSEFLSMYPNFLKLMYELKTTNSEKKDSEFIKLKQAAERYYLSRLAKKSEEYLILDESFCHKLLLILWRVNPNLFSFDYYFQNVPTPDIIIYVDAPSDLCIERQRERGYIVTSDIKEQEKLSEYCLKISKFLQSNHQTKVIYVKNVDSINETILKVKEELENII